MKKYLLCQSNSRALSVCKLPEEVGELVLEPGLTQHHEEGLQGLDGDGAVPVLAVAVHHERCGQRCLCAGGHVQDWRVVGSNLGRKIILVENCGYDLNIRPVF